MRRFLVVGCGGSGGNTLAYLMDQLRSDLSKDNVAELPSGWQFVFVDVPTAIEDGPSGLGHVVAQGGSYIGVGPHGGKYSQLDQAVSQTLRSNGGLQGIATWAPRNPEEIRKPIDVGAGQHRALGRMILLSQARDVREKLKQAWDRLFVRDTQEQMTRTAAALSSTYDSAQPPLIFVVGSMAGGSGASMALDVCRLLTLVPGVNPGLISLFMVSPDIFDELHKSERSGVRANSLAMLGEIVATQSGAAREHDAALLAQLGLRDGQGAVIPFARVFPVGRSMGVEKALFGDGSMNTVYRGLARGLAGLVSSDEASKQFVAYDLGNAASTPPNLNYLGWGSSSDPIPWGSYGFASLSMGRDRYAEYAAQRLARTSADQLMDGHLQPGSTASPADQVQTLLSSQWVGVCARLQLPVSGEGVHDGEVGRWLTTTAFPRDVANRSVAEIIQREVTSYLPDHQQQAAGIWLDGVRSKLRERRMVVTEALQNTAYTWAFDWQQQLLVRVQAEVSDAVSKLGLAYAGALLDRLRAHLEDVVAPGAQILAANAEQDLSEVPAEVVTILAGFRGLITGGDALLAKVSDGVSRRASTALYTRASALTRDSVLAFVCDVIRPLRAAVKEAQTLLEQARASQLRHDGLARLETDQYHAWPTDDDARVPQRFGEANNEVLLTTSDHFDRQYSVDLPRALPQSSGATGRSAVAARVIAGQWPTVQGVQPPGGLLELTHPWIPRNFARDPRTGDALTPSEARFSVSARPRDLLTRARMFIARIDGSFDEFCRVSLRDYVADANVPESQRGERLRDLVTKFTAALGMALPLISADERLVQELHGSSVQYRYKFSAIPFLNLPVADDLRQVLTSSRSLDSSSLDNFGKSLTDQGNPRRIDIFGSYPLYSPLVFDSVLVPVAAEWDGLPDHGRNAYWTLRRARPLEASLAMSQTERRAMVAGWFIAQVVGELRIPDRPYTSPVRIWDSEERRWIDFPYPLLTMPDRFIRDYDWMPAVLESHLLAIAHVQQSPPLHSLRPYLVLRRMYDDNALGPAAGIQEVSSIDKLRQWLRAGSSSGSPSRVPSIADAATSADRLAAAQAWLTGPKGPMSVVAAFLPSTELDSSGGSFSTITTRERASVTPIFRDLAPDVAWGLHRVSELLNSADQRLNTDTSTQSSDELPPAGEVF